MGGGAQHHYNPAAAPKADQDLEALKKARMPLMWRDTCAHLLMPLNKCRQEALYNPYKCDPERHLYKECQYYAWQQRVEAKKQIKESHSA